MAVDLQKAGLWKRIAAWILDVIAMSVVAVGIGVLLAAIMDYDGSYQKYQEKYDQYQTQFGLDTVVFDDSMTPEEIEKVQAADEALSNDQEAVRLYNLLINQSLLIVTLALLFAIVLLEFFVPMWIGNGQTIGKKAFALGLIRNDGVKVNNLQLFTRAVLGKFTLETMIPVYVVLMIFFNMLGAFGTLVLAALVIVQLVVMGVTSTNSAIHDLLAGTVVVDISSQQIFKSTDELIAHTKRIHAEQAARKDY